MPPAIAPDNAQLGLLDRVRGAAKLLVTGQAPYVNPLAETPDDPSEAELVQELNNWCVETREFWKPIYERIKEEQKFACGKQWPKESMSQAGQLQPYVGDIVQQMTNRKTATLYAKNPEPEALRRESMQFTVWDGTQESIDGARNTVATAQQLKAQAMQIAATGQPVPPPPPEAERQVADAQAIINDYEQGMLRNALYDKMAQTATLLIKRQWELQSPDLIVSMKQLVTRVLTSRVGFIKVMYRRELESPSTTEAQINTLSDDLQAMQRAISRMAEPDFDPQSAEAAKFKLLATATKDAEDPSKNVPQDEGIVLDFLSATSVIIDRNCRNLREFVGARRIAHEVLMSVSECEAKYNINLTGAGAVLYAADGSVDVRKTDTRIKPSNADNQAKNRSKVCVFEIQDKDTGCVYTIIDGVKQFIKPPEPNEPMLRRFFNIIPVVFNCQEVEINEPDIDTTIYPRSDIRLAMPMQIDINVAGEGLREHRTANRPCWIGVSSKFASNTGQNDLLKLASPRPAHQVLMLDTLNPGEKIDQFLMALPTRPIDPAMYNPEPSENAMLLATGMQASDLGQQAPNEKATGQQIAAQQKATTDGSNIDDLDFALSTVAQCMWEMLIQEMPKATVQKLVGPGAVWPDLPAERLKTMNEIYLSIEAGSTGRPNELMQIQKFKEVGPQTYEWLQANGYDTEPFIKYSLKILDPDMDLDQFTKKKMPQDPNAGQKPASESITIPFVALSPDEQAQALQRAGIQASGIRPPPPQPKQISSSKPPQTNT